MHMNDLAVRKTLAKLRCVYRDMKREQRLLVHGRPYVNAASTSVAATWARYDWTPPSQMRSPR